MFEHLTKYYPKVGAEFSKSWCKNENGNKLPFDFVLKDYKLIIELDGNQHIKQVMKWPSPEVTQKNDKYKEKCANNNGFSTIRILQEDVLYIRYKWWEELHCNIQKILDEKTVQNIYIDKNNEYDPYRI